MRHHAKGAELTPEGRAFLESAAKLVKCAEQTEIDAQAIAANLAGIIRLGCFHTLAPFYLSEFISSHKVSQPGVSIIATELRQDEIMAAINNDELDLALTYDIPPRSEGLVSDVLAKLRPFIMLDENHPLAKRSSIKMTELADEPKLPKLPMTNSTPQPLLETTLSPAPDCNIFAIPNGCRLIA